MITKKTLELADVRAMAVAAEGQAIKCRVAASIAICDDAGHLLWFQRMDGVSLLSVTMCQAKARTAAISRHPSKIFQQMIDGGMPSLASAEWMQGALEGGVPIIVDGQVVGGIGASGGPGEDDAAIAAAGAAALRA